MKVTKIHVNNLYKILSLFFFSTYSNIHHIISAKSVKSHLKNVYDDIIFGLYVQINYVKALGFFSPVKICVVKRQGVYYVSNEDKRVIFTCCNRKRMLPHGDIFFFVLIIKLYITFPRYTHPFVTHRGDNCTLQCSLYCCPPLISRMR